VKAVLSYLLAFGGVGMMVYALTSVAGRFGYAVAKPMVIHLLRTNPHQAEAMCKADKTTFLCAIGAAIKTAAMMKVRDINIIGKATAPAYDAQVTMINMHWKTVMKRVKTAAGLAVGAVVLGATVGTSVLFLVLLGLVTLAGCVWVLVYKVDVDRSLVLARAEIIPEVERAMAEGRYQFPP